VNTVIIKDPTIPLHTNMAGIFGIKFAFINVFFITLGLQHACFQIQTILQLDNSLVRYTSVP